MGKSKYPSQLDTSVEIPPVRDNVLEVGSDAINSLRSAIFQIERTLGINPQGAVGKTVADRLNKTLDGNGNILEDALDRANVLSGPITNEDVSNVAAINEAKLRLNIPTDVLQAQITVVDNQIDTLITQISEISATLSAHINSGATNRHPATAISVSGAASTPSTSATEELGSGSVQTALQELYDSHINFDGTATADGNSAHIAQQIYFNNENISGFTDADDLQEAVEDLALSSQDNQAEHQDLLHSNGILRIGKIDTATNSGVGLVVAENLSVSFSENDANSNGTTRITFSPVVDIGDFELNVSDIVTITDTADPELLITGSYEIAGIIFDGTGDVISVDVYKVFPINSTSTTLARLSKNINTETNVAGLLVSTREIAGLTSAVAVQICNPNSVRVISTNIEPSSITTSNRFFDISIDGGTAITLDAYNGSVSRQSIDSIVSRINEQCAEQALPILSYRLDKEEGGSELVIAHNLPDESGDVHTLTLSVSTDDGLTSLGFLTLDGITVSSVFGSKYYLNGEPYSGLASKLDTTNIEYFSGANLLTSSDPSIDFVDLKVKVGDLITITEAEDDTDNGSYRITSVTASQLILDSNQLSSGFSSTSGDSTRFRIFQDIVSFEDITFDEVAGTFSLSLCDVFMNSSREVFFKKRLEYDGELSGTDSLITVVDFIGDISDKTFQLVASEGTVGTIISIDSGDSLEISGKDSFVWLNSGVENVSFKIYVQDADAVNTKITSGGSDLNIDIFGFEGINLDSNLLLSRVPFGNFNGRVTGGNEAPRSFYKVPRGNIGPNEISSLAKRELLERPLDELRADGVVYGLKISSASIDGDGFYTFDLENGVCYVGGKRFEKESDFGITTDIDSTAVDKIFIAIDDNGNLIFESALSSCFSPLSDSSHCILASLEFDGTNVANIDLRLFIDNVDLKILNSVTVSPQRGLGHFTTIQEGLRYAKRFNQLFPNAGTPTVHLKSGTYSFNYSFDETSKTYAAWAIDLATSPVATLTPFYDEIIQTGLYIDFPVNLTGEGESTVVKIRSDYEFSDVSYSFRGVLPILGDRFAATTIPSFTAFDDGFISISNMKFDNCRIITVDATVVDSGTNPLSFFVDINNLVFDFRNFTANPLDTSIGAIAVDIDELSDTSDDKGNLAIRNSKFIDSSLNSVAARTANYLVTNNIVFNDPDKGLFLTNPYTFTDADDTKNITIVGNINAANFLSTSAGVVAPQITEAVDVRWGERFGRDVNVGATLNVEDKVVVNNNVISGNFTFDVTKTFNQIYLWSEVTSLDDGPTSAGGTSALAQTVLVGTGGDKRWTYASISSGEEVAMPLSRLPIGCNISQIEIGVSNGNDTWTLEVIEFDLTDNSSSTVYGPASVAETDTTNPAQVTFSMVNFSPTEDKLYYAVISHDEGFAVNSYYFKVILTFSNIDDALGAF